MSACFICFCFELTSLHLTEWLLMLAGKEACFCAREEKQHFSGGEKPSDRRSHEIWCQEKCMKTWHFSLLLHPRELECKISSHLQREMQVSQTYQHTIICIGLKRNWKWISTWPHDVLHKWRQASFWGGVAVPVSMAATVTWWPAGCLMVFEHSCLCYEAENSPKDTITHMLLSWKYSSSSIILF